VEQIRKDRVPLGGNGAWGSPLLSLPCYYYKLYECRKDEYRDVEASVGPLLKNNLVLYGQSGQQHSDVEPGWEIDYSTLRLMTRIFRGTQPRLTGN
jgi:hypothetical protein